ICIIVNQRVFISDAANPVRLWKITQVNHDLDTILGQVVTAILDNITAISTPAGREDIARRYHDRLWRRDGLHPYRLPDGTRFMASIERIAPTGHITLRHADDTLSTHAFKEVSSIITP
ncbi:MAG: biotin--[acetyl-CoA-carboxylase] ligase, partial [Muribaculaceae bacterium]|nr:biotin--[acetyl-CoA-carboxylase] ligase [Muribaculaceae bacterium]